jgi:hypothetical protein
MKIFNRKLSKFVKISQHASILEVDCNRDSFTRHGLHLNGIGKEMIAKELVAHTRTVLQRKENEPIGLYWKSNQTDAVHANVLLTQENSFRNAMRTVSTTDLNEECSSKQDSGINLKSNHDSIQAVVIKIPQENSSWTVLESISETSLHMECVTNQECSRYLKLYSDNSPAGLINMQTKQKVICTSSRQGKALLTKTEDILWETVLKDLLIILRHLLVIG